METETLQKRLETAKEAALEAGQLILKYYQNPGLKVGTKSDQSIVTEADEKAEHLLRERIHKKYPEDGIIGEEHPETKGSSDFSWILDPIDGTQQFACGVPLFGTMIGVLHKKEPVIGVVTIPALGEIYYASRGGGAWWSAPGFSEPIRAQASMARDLSKSLFCTTSHSGFERVGRGPLLPKFMAKTKKFRGWGSCYGHMLVATGRVDLIVEPDLKIWDCAALFPIVTEAGGRFFDLQGRPVIDGGSGISASAHLYEQIMDVIKS